MQPIIKDIILSIVLMIFIISFAVVFTVFFKQLYYFDINYLNIDKYKNEKGETYSKSFKSLFKNIELKLKLFQKQYKRIKLDEVNIEFRNEFVDFLRDEIDFEDSTIAKYIKGIKLI